MIVRQREFVAKTRQIAHEHPPAMNDETEVEDGEDDYCPEPVTLTDGECFIYDPMALCEEYGAIACQFVGGDLWVMPGDTLVWTKVAPLTEAKPGKSQPLKVVQ